jgi:hypothetical protein
MSKTVFLLAFVLNQALRTTKGDFFGEAMTYTSLRKGMLTSDASMKRVGWMPRRLSVVLSVP